MSGWRHAFSLSKDEIHNSEPPGTVKLIDYEPRRTISGNTQHIQLVPPPTQHRYDPLNWSHARKYAVLFTMSFYAFTADFTSGLVASALPVLEFQILTPTGPIPFPRLTKLVSLNVLLFGLSNILWVPLGNIFGRRPVLLFSMLLFTFACMWCGLASTFDSLLAARAVQGFAAGPAYTLAPDIVGAIFFVHEQGRAMAIYTACLALGPFVGGISGGYIAGNLGYKFMFWISTALAAFTFLLEIFLVPETAFNRAKHLAREPSVASKEEKGNVSVRENSLPEEGTSSSSSQFLGFGSFSRFIGLGTYHGDWVHHFAAPWLSLRFPGTWVVMLQYGGLVGGVVAISTVGPQTLAAPPYLWGANAGLLNLGGLIGVIVGALLTFLTADHLVKWRARRESGGFTEPETRLPIMFPGVFLAVTGLWTFGFSLANPSPHAWAGMAVGYGMLSSGLTVMPSVGFNYIIEAYGPSSADCFVATTILRSVVAFAWTYFIAGWVESAGAALPFGIFGMIMAIFGLLAMPLWLFGKRMRVANAKYLPQEQGQ